LKLEDGWTSILIDRITGPVGEETHVVEKSVVSMKGIRTPVDSWPKALSSRVGSPPVASTPT
jgi:hypothetical protein